MQNLTGKLIAVDLDGTLTTSNAWTEEECLNAEPRFDIIGKIRKLYYQMNHIIIYVSNT